MSRSPRYDTEKDHEFSLGQIAYRGYREIIRDAPEWFEVSRLERAGWEVAAISILETIRGQREVRILRPRRKKRPGD